MSSPEDKLIKLPILQYYDENIKKWVSNKLSDIKTIMERMYKFQR